MTADSRIREAFRHGQVDEGGCENSRQPAPQPKYTFPFAFNDFNVYCSYKESIGIAKEFTKQKERGRFITFNKSDCHLKGTQEKRPAIPCHGTQERSRRTLLVVWIFRITAFCTYFQICSLLVPNDQGGGNFPRIVAGRI